MNAAEKLKKAFDMFAISEQKDKGTLHERRVNETRVDGLRVSTVYTSDMGYETAILDEKRIVPVERYESKEKAIIGHDEWVKKIVGMKEVTELSWGGVTDECVYVLERSATNENS